MIWLLIFAGLVAANNVDLGNYKLSPDKLYRRTRFVYSDFAPYTRKGEEKVFPPLKNASVRFDIGGFPLNYDNLTSDEYVRLYVLGGRSKVMGEIESLIESNKKVMDQYALSYDYLLKPFRNEELPIYGAFSLDKSSYYGEREPTNMTVFNASFPID